MFTTALIVFRESLEAALFVGIIAAATRGLAGRGRWLGSGVAAGLAGAVVLALLAQQMAGWLDGLGQDVVTIGVLTLALVMLLWHCVGAAAHGREQVGTAREIGAAVQRGQRAPWALMGVVALAVLREGAETVLFVAGTLAGAADVHPAAVVLSGLLGVALGAGVGLVIYVGLSRLPVRHVFTVTNSLMAVLAASLASQLARALAQAGFVDTGSQPVWDSSAWLSADSPLGTLLHALVGYDARPSLLQLGGYLAVLAFIVGATRWLRGRPPRPPARLAPAPN